MALFGRRMKLYIQDDRGNVYDFSSTPVEITISSFADGYQKIELSLICPPKGFDDLLLDRDDLRKPEWMCPHCRAVNLRASRECEKCGASRPFIYD